MKYIDPILLGEPQRGQPIPQGNGVTAFNYGPPQQIPQQGMPPQMAPQGMPQMAQPFVGPPSGLMNEPVGPALDSRASQMPQYGWKDALLDIGLPVLATAATGGFGLPAALAYGVGKATNSRRRNQDPLEMAKYNAEIAQAQHMAENPHLYSRVSAPRDPATVQEYNFAVQQGFGGTYTDFLQQYKRADRTPSSVIEARTQGEFEQGGEGVDLIGFEAERARAQQTAQTEAKLSAEGYDALASTLPIMNQSYDQLMSIRELIANGPETGPASEYLSLIDPELQVLRAATSGQALSALQQAKAGGATFGSMQIAEWEMLANTVAQLRNNKRANLALLDQQIERVGKQRAEAYKQLSGWEPGQRRVVQPMPAEEAPKPAESSAPQRPAGWDKY